jgi:hypothetical protein
VLNDSGGTCNDYARRWSETLIGRRAWGSSRTTLDAKLDNFDEFAYRYFVLRHSYRCSLRKPYRHWAPPQETFILLLRYVSTSPRAVAVYQGSKNPANRIWGKIQQLCSPVGAQLVRAQCLWTLWRDPNIRLHQTSSVTVQT